MQRFWLALLLIVTFLPAWTAEKLALPVTNEMLIPKRGVNSCLVDARFRINLEGILGCVVNLVGDPPTPAAAGDSHVEPLVSFKKADATPAKSANEDVLYHALLSKEQTVSVSFLDTLSGSIGKKDCIEVTTTERPSVSLAYHDIDVARLVATFNKLPAEQQGRLGVIVGLTPYVVSTAVYTERPTSVGGNYFGVKVGKEWRYKSAEDKSEFYVMAVYAPISLVVALADTKTVPPIHDLALALANKGIDDPLQDLLRDALRYVPLSPTHDPTPRPLLGQ